MSDSWADLVDPDDDADAQVQAQPLDVLVERLDAAVYAAGVAPRDLASLAARLVEVARQADTTPPTRRALLVSLVARLVEVADAPDVAPRDLASLAARVVEVTQEIASLDALAQPAPAPPLVYANVDQFVRERLAVHYAGYADGNTRLWSPTWWRVPQAVSRLEALWRAWEHMRLDPTTGMSAWWRDHADHHMGVLMSGNGPFARTDATDAVCTDRWTPLPCQVPPEGMFDDER